MLRQIAFLLMLIFSFPVFADTENLNWYVDGQLYTTTSCESGSDIILPQTPTKYGYTFQGWKAYTEIEYLENTGTQYIDMEIIAKNSIHVSIPFMIFDDSSSMFFGMRISGNNGFFAMLYTKNSIRFDYYNRESIMCNISNSIYRTKVLLDFNNNNNTFLYDSNNNIICENVFPTDPFVRENKNLLLFATNNVSNIGITVVSHMRIYSTKVYDNNVLIRDFIPVLDENSVPCMYDKVTKQFFYNQGTGDFIAGPAI